MTIRGAYVGDLAPGATSLQRYETLRSLGCELAPVPLYKAPLAWSRASVFGALSFVGWKSDRMGANRALRRLASSERLDLVWIDKGLTIRPDTLLWVRHLQPNAKIVWYSPDDPILRANRSIQHRLAIGLYDLHVTTKSYNVPELLEMGARAAVFVGNAYDPNIHRPLALSDEDRRRWACDVGFVGAFEQPRADSMLAMARAGISVRVAPSSVWSRMRGQHPNLHVPETSANLMGDEYARAISGAKINLGFLRKLVRDQQTTRSVEVPACGAFMLAERTDEHRDLFEEGKEAEFFSSTEELIAKARYYLAHEEQRARIALAGRERCLRSGYSNQRRLGSVLERLGFDTTAHAASITPAAASVGR